MVKLLEGIGDQVGDVLAVGFDVGALELLIADEIPFLLQLQLLLNPHRSHHTHTFFKNLEEDGSLDLAFIGVVDVLEGLFHLVLDLVQVVRVLVQLHDR